MKQHIETAAIALGIGVITFAAYKLLSLSKSKANASPASAAGSAGQGYASTVLNGVDLLNPASYYLDNGARNPAMVLDRNDAMALSYTQNFTTRG